METAQEIELAEAGTASKETAQVKMNNQLAQGFELGEFLKQKVQMKSSGMILKEVSKLMTLT